MADKGYPWYRSIIYSLALSFGLSCQGGCAQKSIPSAERLPISTSTASATSSSTISSTVSSTVAESFPCTINLEERLKYQAIKDEQNQPYFTNQQICLLKDIPSEYSEFIAHTRRVPSFWAGDIIVFSQYKVEKEFARQLGEISGEYGVASYRSFAISRFYQLGLTAEEVTTFKDTKKPNLIVAYPTSFQDSAFENEYDLKLFKDFKEHFDIWTIIWSTEDEIYTAIDKIPQASLWGNGHGTKTTMSSGFGIYLNKDRSNEKFFIDTEDTEIAAHFAKLDPQGFVFMFSCNNGEGGAYDPSNLINFLSRQAGGRDVIGVERSFRAEQVKIISYFPLEITVDVSYHAKKKN